MLVTANHPRRPTIGTVYKYDRARALEMCFDLFTQTAFLWCSRMGPGGVRYGSYRRIRRADLLGRQYEIEFVDSAVALFFTDECFWSPWVHDDSPRTLPW